MFFVTRAAALRTADAQERASGRQAYNSPRRPGFSPRSQAWITRVIPRIRAQWYQLLAAVTLPGKI